MTLPRIAGLSGLATILLASAGCETQQKKSYEPTPAADPITTRWGDAMHSMGLAPVMPMSEDIRVGDVFVSPSNAPLTAGGRVPQFPGGTRWMSLPVSDALIEEYRDRRALPATPAEFFTIDDPLTELQTAEPEPEDEAGIFGSESPTPRLRAVGMGVLSSITFTSGDIEAMVPPEVSNLALGAAWQDNKIVRARISAAEGYGLQLDELLRLFLRPRFTEGGLTYYMNEDLREFLPLAMANGTDSVWVDVVSEVIFARSVDISIQYNGPSEADDPLMASELRDLEYGESMSSDAEVDEDDGEDGGAADAPDVEEEIEIVDRALDPTYAAFVRAAKINRVLIESDTADTTTGAIRLIAATDQSILLRRIFRRGLAIAVRGVSLRIDVETGAVLELRRLEPRAAGT